jgi:hypothetical protein
LGSYLLYPDRELPRFLEKNLLPAGAEASSKLLQAMLKAGDARIVRKDHEGRLRFNADFHNRVDLKSALDELKSTEFQTLVERDEVLLMDLYEAVFDHQSFTGRSGTFFKYEGLGCIYWHMVSKLRLAVEEVKQGALAGDAGTFARLQAHGRDLQEGLGIHLTPARYGAIPSDPYSHTPSFTGAQQPGMTGQVKEDILTRFSGLGVQIGQGRIRFEPRLVAAEEFLDVDGTFDHFDVEGRLQSLALTAGTLAFTLCQVPVVLHREGEACIRVAHHDGQEAFIHGLALSVATSREIFQRSGAIRRLEVFLGL